MKQVTNLLIQLVLRVILRLAAKRTGARQKTNH